MTVNQFEQEIQAFQASHGHIVEQLAKVIVGHDDVIEELLACLLTGGHALLEGVPGIGKTLLVRTLADVLDLSFARVQFTPDLMPTDITGTNILTTEGSGETLAKKFRFQQGPIFANLVLADEINRATPKTQSAVLEAMQEGTVSVARTTHLLPKPFAVLATQNPIELEGTYPLPEAQLDRFMLKIFVDMPTPEQIARILDRTTGSPGPMPQKVADANRIEEMKFLAREVKVAPHVTEYIARLVSTTHPTNPDAPDMVRQFVRFGSSPRGGQAIMLASKVSALCNGRANVAFDDVSRWALPALRHRLILNFEGQAEQINPDQIIQQTLQAISK